MNDLEGNTSTFFNERTSPIHYADPSNQRHAPELWWQSETMLPFMLWTCLFSGAVSCCSFYREGQNITWTNPNQFLDLQFSQPNQFGDHLFFEATKYPSSTPYTQKIHKGGWWIGPSYLIYPHLDPLIPRQVGITFIPNSPRWLVLRSLRKSSWLEVPTIRWRWSEFTAF